MIALTPKAQRQVRIIRDYYIHQNRPAAPRNLRTALVAASAKIERNPADGKASPPPYSAIAYLGMAWIKSGRYWIAYSTAQPPVITGVFFETSDIPNLV